MISKKETNEIVLCNNCKGYRFEKVRVKLNFVQDMLKKDVFLLKQ
jgi:hypothetical protein